MWVKAMRDAGLAESKVVEVADGIAGCYVDFQENSFPGVLGNVIAGRIANRLDLGGTNCVTDAACASAFGALAMAAGELWLGSSDLVITGGSDTMNDIFMYMCFSKTTALSMKGDCTPFSDDADGTMLGEGIGMVALKRLDDAERDGDHIYAVLRGVGSSSDGRAKSIYAPVPRGQASAVRRAYELAGFGPDTVELLEAHGTGTKAGDAAEFKGLVKAFRESGRDEDQWCGLGTVKSQIGPTKAAAGAAGLIKAVMALHHKVLPPTIKVDRPNPNMDLDTSPFYLSLRSRPWIRSSEHPRRAGVSSFGFGGSNFHLAIEEYTGPRTVGRLRTAPTEVIVVSAATPAALIERCEELANSTDGREWLAHTARATQLAFDPSLPARASVVAQVATHAASKPDAPFATPSGVLYANGAEPGKVAFLFPGQGSQYLDMGAQLAMSFDAALSPWDREADAPVGDTALHNVVFPRGGFEGDAADVARLTATENAQPAIGITSASMLALFSGLGVEPDCVGGHSFGEIRCRAR
jgi:acyl transferase domain-containing protein